MSNFFTTQEKRFPSVWIHPTVDFTTQLEPTEKGVACTIGKIDFGNPNVAVILGSPADRLKTTDEAKGGDLRNELAYHIADYFNQFGGKVVVGRALGADSTVKTLVVDTANGAITEGEDIAVFGGAMEAWANGAGAGVELLVSSCIAKKFSVTVSCPADDYIEITLYDETGSQFYTVSGSVKVGATNDFGQDDFIGSKGDSNILQIRLSETLMNNDEDTVGIAKGSFETIVYEATNGVVTEAGDPNLDVALEAIKPHLEQCDYYFTGGLIDVEFIKGKIKPAMFKAKVLMTVDIVGDEISEAIAYKQSLGLDEEYVRFVWNRGADKFKQGNQKIGVSGLAVGFSVKRNLSNVVGYAEFRLEGTAGVDYPISRVKATSPLYLNDDEKTLLTDERINAVVAYNGKLVLGDVLSANPKWQYTTLYPVVEGKYLIDRQIARFMISKFFKSTDEARDRLYIYISNLFKDCERNGYFSNDFNINNAFRLDIKAPDTIICRYQYIPNGIFRRGQVKGAIVGEITLKI